MQRLTLDQVRPSFILAKPATDDKDRTLIAEGAVLSETHIEALRKRGVVAVHVIGHPVETGEEPQKPSPLQRKAFIEQAFTHWSDNPVMMRFKQAFIEQIALKIKREAAARDAEASPDKTARKKGAADAI